MIEKVCGFECRIKCPFCNVEYVNPDQWINCRCGATIRITWKAIARKINPSYSPKMQPVGNINLK